MKTVHNMLFDLSNYWIFPVLVASAYALITNFVQGNVGGKGHLKALQLEIRELQKKMTEAAKSKNEKEMNESIDKNWKLTGEMMRIQMQLFAVLIMLLFGVGFIFPHIEPGTQDDTVLQLFDDGLASHCDAAAGDFNFSNCYTLPKDGKRGAWVVDAFLFSPSNETLSRNATAIYFDGGSPSDVWLQSSTQSGFLDGFLGKVPHYLSITTDKENYTAGETVAIRASASPPPLARIDASGGMPRYEAHINSGTFFYVDLPFSIPLINIRRIIGSYGLFLFSVFLLSMGYSIIKAVYDSASKKK